MAYLSNLLIKDTIYEIAAKYDEEGNDISKTYATKEELDNSSINPDASIKSESDRAKLQEDTIESAIGLAENGTHISTTGNYTNKATTIAEEIEALDAQLKTTTDNLETEINRATSLENTIESSIGLSESGTHITTSGNYTSSATTVVGEIATLDSALKTESDRAISQEDTIENAIGLAKDGTHVTTSGNYTSKATTITDEIAALDTQVKVNTDNINTETSRAQEAEKAISANLNQEIKDARAAEKINSDAIVVLQAEDVAIKSDLAKKIEKVTIEKNPASDLQYILYVDNEKVSEINIAKDQFLKDVSYDSTSKKLHFVFETTDGVKEQDVEIGDVVDTYTAGDGLKVENYKFSAVINNDSEKYLTLSNEGLKISGIDSALATKAEVGTSYTKAESDSKYLTEHQSLDALATKEALANTDANVTALDVRIKANEDSLAIVNGNEETDGSIKKALADSKTYADTVVKALVMEVSDNLAETNVKVTENAKAIEVLNGNETTEGSIKKSLADVKTYVDDSVNAEIERAKTSEKSNADAIAANETSIEENEKAINSEVSRAKQAEQANADAITAEVTRAKAAEGVLEGNVATNTTNITKVTEVANQNKSDIANEVIRATTAETANSNAITTETTRAQGVEESIASRVAENEGNITALTTLTNETKSSLESEISRATIAETSNADAIKILNSDNTTVGSVAKSIKDVIETLNVSEIGGTTKYITSIKEEGGKITANAEDLTTSLVNRTATEASDTQIALTKTTVEGALIELAESAKTLQNNIDSLDLKEIGTTGQVITKISLENGQISASASDLTSSIVSRKSTDSSSTKVAVTGTNVEEAIDSLATSIKTVKDNAAKYSIKKVTDNLSNNVKEAYLLVETVEGTSTDVGSQIPIYKDSSLKSVELANVNDKEVEGQFLKFTYITDEGADNIVYLDVSTFLVEAEFKDGLQVNSSGEVSIKIADDSKFLSVDENGLKVSGIENTPTVTDKVTVSKEITVEGGPLADLYKNALGKNTIDANITMLKLLEILFTKELWPTNITFTEGTISASIAAPSFSVNSTLVEVGSTVTVSACTPTSTSYSTSARKLSGLTYGYSADKVTKNTSTSISVAATNATLNGNYTVTRTVIGNPETKTGSISEVALASTSFTANEGSNIVKVAITGASASCNFAALNSVWYYSNLDNTEDTHKTSAYTAVTKSTSTPSNSKSVTVTGVYPVYATKSSIASLDKLSLQTSTTYEISMPAETSTDKLSFAIYNGKSIKSILRFDTVANTYLNYSLSDFTTSTVSYTIGTNNTVTYTKYTRNAGTNGATKFKIILL